ncbi:hypothetical protein, partial [Marivirga sp.]|uniref:hypothetical protein n=1 Tax=Marivirga sp. TaxID=2018662 RepID=UPI003DA71E67
SDIQNCYLTQNAIPTLSLFFAKFIYYFVAGKLNQTYERQKKTKVYQLKLIWNREGAKKYLRLGQSKAVWEPQRHKDTKKIQPQTYLLIPYRMPMSKRRTTERKNLFSLQNN